VSVPEALCVMSKSIKIVGGLTALKLAGAIVGICYMILQVRYFGTAHEVEIFFAAQSVVYVIISLTQSGQLTEVYLPEYLKLKNNYSHEAAYRSYSVLTNRLSVFILLLVLLAFLMAPYLMEMFIPGFSSESRQDATLFFRAFLPLILLQIHVGFLTTVLNAERIFGRAEAAALVNHFFSITVLFCFYDSLGIWTLLLSSYIGLLIQVIVLGYYAQRLGIKYYFIWRSQEFQHRKFFGTIFYTFTYTVSTQILNWAIVASTSFLPQGVFAIFKYVEKLVPKVISILIDPFTVVYFTKIANEILNSPQKRQFRTRVVALQEYSLLFGLLIFTLSVASGKEILSLIWGGEKVSSDDVSVGYSILIAFFLALAFQMFYAINRKLSVVLGLAKYNYSYQSFVQLIAAGSTFLLVYAWDVPGLLASIIFSRAMLIFIPTYINSRMSPSFYDSPNGRFFLKFFLILTSLPLAILGIKGLLSPLMLIENGAWSDLWQSIFWGCMGLMLNVACLQLLRIDVISILRKHLSRFCVPS
jgi:putative peptidoglycan lipid II flippase